MRVLMLAQFYAPIIGGEERMVETLATTLAGRGHEVVVATLRQPGQAEYEERGGIAIHRLPGLTQRLPWLFSESERRHAPPAPDPETLRALKGLLRTFDPDLVHAHNWLDNSYLPLARRARAAYVVSLHDYSLVCANKRLVRDITPCEGPGARCIRCTAAQYGPLSGPPIALLTAASGRRRRRLADLMLPISEYVAARCGLPDGPTPYEVMPNFVLDDTGPPADPPPGLPETPYIQFAGDLTADKGVLVLLEAYAGLSDPLPLALIGRTVAVDAAAPPPGTTVTGPVPHEQVLAAWRNCSIGIVPSLQPEAFGLVALEAMRAGKPVIAARSGGLAEVVTDGESGLVVPPGDGDALRGAMQRLLDDDELRLRLGEGAARRAALFTAAAVIPRVEAAYERAIEHRAQRRSGT